MPECVPKFVTELVLPLPMPTGSKQVGWTYVENAGSPRNHSRGHGGVAT
jgi:hypothetical protein